MTILSAEKARVRACVVGITALVDLRRWDELSQLFAPQVFVDYSSLWGEPGATMAKKKLLEQWQALVPGFDATCHAQSDITVSVEAATANATSDVRAQHLIDGKAWIVEGRYQFEMRKSQDGWQVSALTYVHRSEEGDRRLTEQAKARAKR